jgi:hypothetical protein
LKTTDKDFDEQRPEPAPLFEVNKTCETCRFWSQEKGSKESGGAEACLSGKVDLTQGKKELINYLGCIHYEFDA